jgi:hypothetical protein
MALFPCAVGEHRYPGRQQAMYPALVNGADATRARLRLCPKHFDAFAEKLADHCRNAQQAFDDPMLLACGVCGKLVEDSAWQFFVTVYATGADRQDWWAPLHEDCAFAMADDWQLDPQSL